MPMMASLFWAQFPLLLLLLLVPSLSALNFSQLFGPTVYGIKLGALWNLEQMTWCRLDLSAGLTFNGYGCWCGKGGSGNTVDGIDACCLQHDLCYGWVQSDGKCASTWAEYVSQYEWNCTAGQGITCSEANHGCGQQICQCDRQLVECWKSLARPSCKKLCKTAKCHHSPSPGDEEADEKATTTTIITMGVESAPDGAGLIARLGNQIGQLGKKIGNITFG